LLNEIFAFLTGQEILMLIAILNKRVRNNVLMKGGPLKLHRVVALGAAKKKMDG
jgi:hypothetical protein